jgi:hypothetical protein
MKCTLAVVFATAIFCAPLHAQGNIFPVQFPTTVGRDVMSPSPAHQMDTKAAIDDMRVALHDLIVAQEKYWNDHGTYTTDGSALGTYPPKRGQPSAQVIFAGSRGWTGMATDRSLQGKNCVVYIGSEKELPGDVPKTMGGVVATAQGVSVCDEP